MTNILIFDPLGRPISADDVKQVLESEAGFHSIRENTPSGTLVEGTFEHGDDFTTVRLSSNGERVSFSGASDAALNAALVLGHGLQQEFRIVDTDYTFDLNLSDYSTLDELSVAIDEARQDSRGSSPD